MDKGSIKRDWQYCQDILPKVSRTFALNIEQLEGEIFKTVLIGYLIFRIADTFEDNVCRSEDDKIVDLKNLSTIFEGDKDLSERLRLYESLKFRWKESSYEKNLVENGHRVLRCYFDLHSTHRKIVDPLVAASIGGMIKFKELRINRTGRVFQLKDIEELEEYCYYVAGIVGIMLTEIFCQREGIKEIKSELERYHIHFGLALQFVNIIKDYEKDIARGWCFIPSTVTEKYKINLDDIGGLSAEQRQGMVKELSRHAVTYLDSTLKYIELLPLKEKSIRMFCIIPFVLAYSTLAKLIRAEGNKLSRKEVAYLLERCNTYAISNSDLKNDYHRIKDGVFIW